MLSDGVREADNDMGACVGDRLEDSEPWSVDAVDEGADLSLEMTSLSCGAKSAESSLMSRGSLSDSPAMMA